MTVGGTDQPRLNPFAFVSDTGLRFALLMFLIVGGSARYWFSIASSLTGVGSRVKDCLNARSASVDAMLHFGASRQVAISCVVPASGTALLMYIGTGLGLLAVATWLIYRAYPWWKVRRLQLERIDPADVPELMAELETLCQLAKLRRQPEFWWNPLDCRPNIAVAFGIRGHRRVALTGAVAHQFYGDRKAFRTVLLHELAHLRNRDVTLTYLALSVWWAFVATALLPSLTVTAMQPLTLPDIIITVTESGLLALCVLLTRNAVLRARELYADARSLTWHTDAEELTRVFGEMVPIPRLRRLLSRHPAPHRRQRLLANMDELFLFNAWDAFGIGSCAGLLGLFWMFLIESHGIPSPLLLLAPFLTCVPLVAGALAIGVWRAAFLALMRGRARAPTLPTAAAVTIGSVLGCFLLPVLVFTIAAAGVGGPAAEVLRFGTIGPWAVIVTAAAVCSVLALVLTLITAALLAWIETVARCWLTASLPSRSPPQTAFAVCIAVCAFIALSWLVALLVMGVGTTFVMRDGSMSGPVAVLWVAWIVSQLFPLNLLTWLAVVMLWALPLAAAPWSRPRNTGPWVFLDAAPYQPDARGAAFFLRRAALIGTLGGIIATLSARTLELELPPSWLRGLHDLEQESPRLMIGVLAQGIVGTLTALVTPRLAIPHALFAAFVTGCLFAFSEVLHVYTALDGRTSLSALAAIFPSFIIFSGVAMALVCAGIAGPSAARMRWLFARDRVTKASV